MSSRPARPERVEQLQALLRERILVPRAQEDEARIRGDRERRFDESEVLEIHEPARDQSRASRLALPPTAARLTVTVRSLANRSR